MIKVWGCTGRPRTPLDRGPGGTVNVLCDLSGGLAVWTSFIFQSILNTAFRLADRVRAHQIKKIALNYPINIIIFAPLQHYIMKPSGFTHSSPSALIYKGAVLVNENWIVIMQLVQMKNCSEDEDSGHERLN